MGTDLLDDKSAQAVGNEDDRRWQAQLLALLAEEAEQGSSVVPDAGDGVVAVHVSVVPKRPDSCARKLCR